MSNIEVKEELNAWLDQLDQGKYTKDTIRSKVMYYFKYITDELRNINNLENETKLEKFIENTTFFEDEVLEIRKGVEQVYTHYKENSGKRTGDDYFINKHDGEVHVIKTTSEFVKSGVF